MPQAAMVRPAPVTKPSQYQFLCTFLKDVEFDCCIPFDFACVFID